MINQLPEISVPDWLAEISQSTITIDPFPLTQVLEDSLYYPSSGFDGDPIKYLSGNILSFIYVDYRHSQDKFENEILKRGFRGYERVATRSVTEQELTPRGWRPRQPTQYHGERSSNDWFDHDDLTIEGFKIFHHDKEKKFRELSQKFRIRSEELIRLSQDLRRLSEMLPVMQEQYRFDVEPDFQGINDRLGSIESEFDYQRKELEHQRQEYKTECKNLMGEEFWREKEPYCSWSIFQRGEDVPSIHGPPRFSLLYLCADGVAAFQALYYANSASPKAVAVIQPGTAFGGNWTNFEDPSGIFARTVFGNPKGSPQILLNGGYGKRDFYREPCWPSYSELTCFLDKTPELTPDQVLRYWDSVHVPGRGSIGVWAEIDKPGSAPESHSND